MVLIVSDDVGQHFHGLEWSSKYDNLPKYNQKMSNISENYRNVCLVDDNFWMLCSVSKAASNQGNFFISDEKRARKLEGKTAKK